MSREFTSDEIKELIGTARVYCPDLNEARFQSLIEMEKHLADSGYLEAVRGLAKLQRENIPCSQALDEYKALQRRLSDLESKTSNARAKLDALQKEIQQAEENYKQLKDSVEKAQKELAQVRATRTEEGQKIAEIQAAAIKDKQQMDREVAKYQQKANVSKEDIAMAGKLKAEVEANGLTMEIMLDLAKEFTAHENARDELASNLQQYHTLHDCIGALNEQYQEKKKALEIELKNTQSEIDGKRAEAKNLEATRHNHESVISRLQSDLAYEDEIRRFYRRYWGLGGLMEYLASWEQILFLRCNNPISAIAGVFNPPAGVARFWTDKPIVNCPHCGLKTVLFDEKAYSAINWPVGAPGRLPLGE